MCARSALKSTRTVAAIVVVTMAASALRTQAQAQNHDWIDPNGGAFGDAGNWQPAEVPGLADTAVFDLAAEYLVQLGVSEENSRLLVNDGTVNLRLFNSVVYELTEIDPDVPSIRVGPPSPLGGAATLRVTSPPSPYLPRGRLVSNTANIGTTFGGVGEMIISGTADWVAEFVNIGPASGSIGSLTIEGGAEVESGQTLFGSNGGVGTAVVRGSGSLWTIPDIVYFDIGEDPSPLVSTLTIQDGGGVFARVSRAGANPGAEGAVTVDGVDSSWVNTLAMSVGSSGTGSLAISNGGYVYSNATAVALHPGSSGTATVTGPGSWWNAYRLIVGGGPDIDEFGPGGTGTVVVTDGGLLTVESDLVIWPDGTLVVDEGTVDANIIELNGGGLSGNGVLNASAVEYGLINNGVISPGFSPGTLTLDGDYLQEAEGVLEIEIAGEAAGEFDVLDISGLAALAGTLSVSFLDGFEPAGEMSVQILAATSIEGAFEQVLFDGIEGEVEYGQDGVVLTFTTSCSTDFNDDGQVGPFDLAALLAEWGPCPEACTPDDPADTCGGDLNGDCVVGPPDLAVLLGNWGPCLD